MCSVSMILDHHQGQWPQRYPNVFPAMPVTLAAPVDAFKPFLPPITRAEFDALKKELEDLKLLLVKAKKYDEETGQKDCEMADKVALLKRLAKLVGVDLSELQLEGK